MTDSHKTRNLFLSIPSYSTLGHITKEISNISQVYLLNYLHSNFIHNSSIEKWIKKMRYIYTIENNSAVLKNDIWKVADWDGISQNHPE